jgi:aspartate kinase
MSDSEIHVLKFGGTSVVSLESMKICASRVREFSGNRIVVVSAQAGETDALYSTLTEFKKAGVKFKKEEEDLVVTTGENKTAALFSGVLNSTGTPAIPLLGWQVPIWVRDARVENVETKTMRQLLKQGFVLVVTGFQGVNQTGALEALSRGGSDVSAVSIAAAVGSTKCHIFTDVPGIYQHSPLLQIPPSLFQELDYDDAFAMASNGSQVIHPEAVKKAQLHGVCIVVKSTFCKGEGTQIKSGPKNFGVSVQRREGGFQVHFLHYHLLPTLMGLPQAAGSTEEELWFFTDDLAAFRSFFLQHGGIRGLSSGGLSLPG